MVNRILTEAGYVKDVTYAETQFVTPPRSTYAVYNDSFTRRGGDSVNLLKEHDITIEQYSAFPDPEAEARLEAILDRYAIEYDKAERYWINAEQLWQVVYTFSYIEK